MDFNVPLQNGRVKDDWRIKAVMPTLEFLRKAGAKIIIVSHLGRPIAGANSKSEISIRAVGPTSRKGRNPCLPDRQAKQIQITKIQNSKLSLKSVHNYLKKLVPFKIDFTNAMIGSKILAIKIQKMKAGEVLMLENVRFYAGEEKNDSEFAKKLAGLADIFVNDAFAVSHRDCASITGVAKFLPSYAGLNLAQEIDILGRVLKNPKKPMVVLMGGAKISDKIGVIKKLLPKSKAVLIGGALANNFLKVKNYNIGGSLYEKDGLGAAKSLLKNSKIILPQDVVITNLKKAEIKLVEPNKKNLCPPGWKIVDIGPRTIKSFSDFIRKAQTIVWNGPMGYFEKPEFSYGSTSMAQVVGARSTGHAFGLVGGGETIEVLRKSGMEKYIDWVSTGGGAMLEYLEKGILPGIKPLLK